MSKKNILAMMFVVVVMLGVMWVALDEKLSEVLGIGGEGRVTIVVDAGHGGIDGGAESRGGVCEKDINLSIAMKIKERAEEKHWEVIMTRDSDVGLYSEEKGSIRSKKTQDLKNRREIINDSGAEAAISIHLNSYPSESVKGAQTFFSKNSDEGKLIAEIIQNRIHSELDEENERVPMAKDDILIMKENRVPLVLLECGFLSNQAESEKLQRDDYQDKIAKIVVEALEEYFINCGKLEPEIYEIILSD